MNTKATILVFAILLMLTSCQGCIEPHTTSSEVGNLTSPEVVWEKTFEDAIVDWIANENTLYVLDQSGHLTQVNGIQNREGWKVGVAGRGPLSLAGDVVIVPAEDANVITGIDIAEGKILWQTSLPELETCSVGAEVSTGTGKIFIGCLHTIYALDSKNGDILWKNILTAGLVDQAMIRGYGYTARPFTALTYTEGALYARIQVVSDVQRVQVEGNVLALDSETGQEQWRFAFYFFPPSGDAPMSFATPLLVGENYLFFISWDGQYYFVDRSTGCACSFYDETGSLCFGQAGYIHDGIVMSDDTVRVWNGEQVLTYSPFGNPTLATDQYSLALPDWRQHQAVAIQNYNDELLLWRAEVSDDSNGFAIMGFDVLSGAKVTQNNVPLGEKLERHSPKHSYMAMIDNYLILAKDQHTLIAIKMTE